MLSTADLAAMRTMQETALPDSCDVKRRVLTTNNMGGSTTTYPKTTHAYACRLSSRGIPNEYVQMAATRNQTPWMVTFAHDDDVLVTDRLVIGTRTLEVIGIASGGTWETARRVACVEVT